ncbi:bilin-binding protein-like [Aricia agestis]|uniref:bilin-binding protein-like n=1 Tax=Aricia agestis TaxID=91739 RepID=UPI001C20B109|nr:bilin-binding protein-like [Aricia agestis]
MLLLYRSYFLILAYYLATIECKCPEITPAKNIDLDKFASGTWYDVAISHNNLTNGEIFASLTYTKKGNKITFETAGIPKDDINYVEGSAKVLSYGKFLYTYIVGEPKEQVDNVVTIAALDDDFLSLYGCKNDDEHQEIVWVATRVEKPEGALKAKVQNYLDTYISPYTKQHAAWMTKF